MEEKLEGSSSKDVHFTVPSSSYKIKYYMLQVSRKKGPRTIYHLKWRVSMVVNAAKVVLILAFDTLVSTVCRLRAMFMCCLGFRLFDFFGHACGR